MGHRRVALTTLATVLVMVTVLSGAVPRAGAARPRPDGVDNLPSLYQPVAFGAAAPIPTTGVTYDFPVVGMAATPDGGGQWLVASDGGVLAFGDAGFAGSMGGSVLGAPVVGMAATPDGHGYWLVAADGGVFAFGDAGFHGSMGGSDLDAPVVGMAATPDGGGYWLVASDGGVFAFGDARYAGSTGGERLVAPVVGLAGDGAGGYWLVAADGGVFAYGGAGFHGSMGGVALNAPVTSMSAAPGGPGYWLVAADGGVFAFGGARFLGSLSGPGSPPRQPVAVGALVASPGGDGYWLLPEASVPVVTIQGWTGVEPAVVAFSGDAGDIVVDTVWSSWTDGAAVGRGTWAYDDCTPDCAEGAVTDYPATLTLSAPSSGRFTRITEVTSGPHGFSETFALPGPIPLT